MPVLASPYSQVRDTIYALLATYLATGTKDIFGQFANIPKDAAGHRYFTFEGVNFVVSNRPNRGLFIAPGINVYFGDTLATLKKDLPQRWRLPVNIHVLAPYTNEPSVGEKQAIRVSELVQNCFERSGGRQQVYDFSTSPASPVIGRFVSWARSYRGVWKELGDPTTEDFTNRNWNIEVRYVR